jgi:hypothetical protein
MGAPSSMGVNSDEAGKWYYVVDCATCNSVQASAFP